MQWDGLRWGKSLPSPLSLTVATAVAPTAPCVRDEAVAIAPSPSLILVPSLTLALGLRFNSGPGAHAHETESFQAFNDRYTAFFTSCTDLFELQRGLNNCFAYDLVPNTQVITEALKAARKVNDYATAVRILEGLKEKVENKGQYQAYLDELKPILKDLGESSTLERVERDSAILIALNPLESESESESTFSVGFGTQVARKLIQDRCRQQGRALRSLKIALP